MTHDALMRALRAGRAAQVAACDWAGVGADSWLRLEPPRDVQSVSRMLRIDLSPSMTGVIESIASKLALSGILLLGV
jgi:hypothetical protein